MNLEFFKTQNFPNALKSFFDLFNIPINCIDEGSIAPKVILKKTYKDKNPAHLLMDDVFILGGVDDTAFKKQSIIKIEDIKKDYEGILIFGLTLNKRPNDLLPTRSQLAEITRAFNREFCGIPVVVLFKYDNYIALANAERMKYNQEWREGEKAGKVSLLRDINVLKPHTGHLKILQELTIRRTGKGEVNTFSDLYTYWQSVFNVSILNKKFYKELSDWYFWALHEVHFPTTNWEADKSSLLKDDEKVKEHNAKNLIRMLTRLLFVWFVKEKKLIPEELFDEAYIKENLINGFEPRKKKNFDHKTLGSKYYRAILQNLFFATLNQTVGKREFRKEGLHMNVTNLMRYESYFKNPKVFIKLVENIVPFMNGGLFECLDSPDPLLKGKRGGDLIVYEDGFSDRKDNTLCVPDYIFFGTDEHADLSAELGDKKLKDVTVKGLINILNSYKFTVTENTPIEEDIALDPELLGRVFENLLASYNPETKTTARKQTGSFYTPREIVNYMVDESLKAYLKQRLETKAVMKPDDAERKLDLLIGYNEIYFQNENRFDDKQTAVIINAIDNCKILDPACGSGAFPMGILHKLVHILHKLDPDNKLWKEVQRQKAIKETEEAFMIGNKEERENRLKEISDVFEYNSDDYGRKLFLIENCIYGVDIQPIATQISKLRFFISLIVDQKSDNSRNNFGIRPLPNLETKFVAANTLIGIDKPKAGDYTGSIFDTEEVKQLEIKLKDVRHRLFSAKTPATKRKLREEDQVIREKIRDLLVQSGWETKSASQLATWDPYNQNISSDWFDPEWMFGIENGFDVVIGNPPYIGEKDNSYLFEIIKSLNQWKDFYRRRTNTYYLFIKLSTDLLNIGGTLSLIIPREFLTADWANKLRSYILKNSIINHFVDFGENFLFESANTSSLIIMTNKGTSDNYYFPYSTIISDQENSSFAIKNYFFKKHTIFNKDIDYSGTKLWCFQQCSIKTDDKKIGRLRNYFSVSQGLVTGADKITWKHIESGLAPENLFGRGIFILKEGIDIKVTNKSIYLLINRHWVELDKSGFAFIKPYISSIHLDEWSIKDNDEYILYVGKKSLTNKIILDYLSQFELPLLNRCKTIKDIITPKEFKRYTNDDIARVYSSAGAVQKIMKKRLWYLPLYERTEYNFEGPKIIVNSKSMFPFTYSEQPYYSSGGGLGGQNFIFPHNKLNFSYYSQIEKYSSINDFTKYVNVILNSDFVIKNIKDGKYNQLSTAKIEDLPVIEIDFTNEKQSKIYLAIIRLVNTMIKEKKINPNVNTNEIRNELNSLVSLLF